MPAGREGTSLRPRPPAGLEQIETPMPIPERRQPRHVKLFLARSKGWEEKVRRRAATLLGLCDETTGLPCTMLVLQDPKWLDHLIVTHDQVTFTLTLTAEMTKAWEACGLAHKGAAENILLWREVMDGISGLDTNTILMNAVAATKAWPKEDADRLRAIVSATGLKTDGDKYMAWFLMEDRRRLKGVDVMEGTNVVVMDRGATEAYCRWNLAEGLVTREDHEAIMRTVARTFDGDDTVGNTDT